MWNLKKVFLNIFIYKESIVEDARGGGLGLAKRVKRVKRYKIPVIK